MAQRNSQSLVAFSVMSLGFQSTLLLDADGMKVSIEIIMSHDDLISSKRLVQAVASYDRIAFLILMGSAQGLVDFDPCLASIAVRDAVYHSRNALFLYNLAQKKGF